MMCLKKSIVAISIAITLTITISITITIRQKESDGQPYCSTGYFLDMSSSS